MSEVELTREEVKIKLTELGVPHKGNASNEVLNTLLAAKMAEVEEGVVVVEEVVEVEAKPAEVVEEVVEVEANPAEVVEEEKVDRPVLEEVNPDLYISECGEAECVIYKGEEEVRTYSLEVHGEKYKELAESFLTKMNK